MNSHDLIEPITSTIKKSADPSSIKVFVQLIDLLHTDYPTNKATFSELDIAILILRRRSGTVLSSEW